MFESEYFGLTNTPRVRAALIRCSHIGAVRLAGPNDPTGVARLTPQLADIWRLPSVAAVVRAYAAINDGVRIALNGARCGELAGAVCAGRMRSRK